MIKKTSPKAKIHYFKVLKWYGPSGDNGFDQTTTKPSIYGTCAHFSSEDQKKNTGGNLMPNILEDLYYGNLSPCQRATRPGSCVKKLMQKQSDLEAKLNGSFTEEQRASFEQYLSITADLLDANCLDSFITGFRLGAQFTFDTFFTSKAPYTDYLKYEQ